MISNVQQADFTPLVTFLRGSYSLWHYQIPYFSGVVPLRFAAKNLSLVEELPGAETIEWSLQELFQRDISWDRVNKEISSYLRSENRPQFFNALTVALVPKGAHGLDGEYTSNRIYTKAEDDALEEPIEVGGIQVYPYKGSQNTAGKLRWDVDQIAAVAVDGQHRLAAIKTVSQTLDPDKLDSTSIPIIFIIPDERVGFVTPRLAEHERAISSPLRRIFSDLNKNAREVSKARNILLDDMDITSVCVRALIGKRLGDDDISEERIPLVVVDWISESNKIDSGPFITTILQLYELVSECLSVPDMSEVQSESDPRFQNWLQNSLNADEETSSMVMDQVRRCYGRQVPLTLLPENIDKLENCFKKMWRPGIFKVFSELTPYKNTLDYLNENDLNEPWFINLYSAEYILKGPEAEKKADRVIDAIKTKNEEWNKERDFDPHIHHIDDNLKAGSWPFTVVFQRALLLSYSRMCKHYDSFDDTDEVDYGDWPRKFADRWIEAVDALLESRLGARDARIGEGDLFWIGSGLSADQTIEFTKAGRDRLAAIISCWVCLYWLEDLPSWKEFESLDTNNANSLLIFAFNLLNDKGLCKGLSKYARSRLEDDSDDAIEAFVHAAKRRRYNAMKRVHQHLA